MKETTRKALRILCAIIFICAVGFLVFYFVQEKKDKELYENLQKNAEKQEEPEQDETKNSPEIPIDFQELQKTNPDIYAWIKIPGTKIDYPVLQNGFDDTFYLSHTADGEYGSVGSIYTERQTAKDFSDFNTVMYGHNVPNGTMFRGLHQYEDMEFMEEHPEVIIYTPDAKRVYKIFAAVVYDDRHILHSFDYAFEDQRQAFLDSIYNSRNLGNVIRDDVSVNTDSRILTLSTCMTGQDDKRFLVEAVLISEED